MSLRMKSPAFIGLLNLNSISLPSSSCSTTHIITLFLRHFFASCVLCDKCQHSCRLFRKVSLMQLTLRIACSTWMELQYRFSRKSHTGVHCLNNYFGTGLVHHSSLFTSKSLSRILRMKSPAFIGLLPMNSIVPSQPLHIFLDCDERSSFATTQVLLVTEFLDLCFPSSYQTRGESENQVLCPHQ